MKKNKNKTAKKEAKNGQKSKVATLGEECHDIVLELRHRAKRVATSTIAVRVATSAEGCRTEGSES